MPIGEHTPRTYTHGDTIKVELELTDDSGIYSAQIPCVPVGDNPEVHQLTLYANASGEKQKTLTLRGTARAELPPGPYEGAVVRTQDWMGNRATRTLSPPISLTVEAAAVVDTEAPAVGGWGFAGEPPAPETPAPEPPEEV